jgi:hypothetical protein
MRALLFVPVLFCLVACTGPRVTHIRYSPPSAAPVRKAVQNAQDYARQAKKDIADARTAPNPDAAELALQDADGQIDKLTEELLTAQTAIADYETKTGEQTEQLNTCDEQKNAALKQRDDEKEKASRASGKLWRTRGLLLAAVAWIFRTPLLGLAKLLGGLIAKIPIGF